jgi:hypothetical protein
MKSLLSSSELKKSTIKSILWDKLKEITKEEEGCLYYKYPITGMSDSYTPCFTIVDYNNGVLLFEIIEVTIDYLEISGDNSTWTINNNLNDSPLLKLEDYKVRLENIIRNYRQIRDKISVQDYIVFPTISRSEFVKKHNSVLSDKLLFDDFYTLNYKSLFKTEIKCL